VKPADIDVGGTCCDRCSVKRDEELLKSWHDGSLQFAERCAR